MSNYHCKGSVKENERSAVVNVFCQWWEESLNSEDRFLVKYFLNNISVPPLRPP